MAKTLKNHKENFKYGNGRFFNGFVHVGLFLNIVFAIWLTYLIMLDWLKLLTSKKMFMAQYGMASLFTSLA